ncbi:uncharacterized protein [Onthophagus taurus]|uniref:uncharacterized protein isoform X2 n=1 Tax=Onthophagus taurus TaxID=166361 RepID=UPI0039BE7A7D
MRILSIFLICILVVRCKIVIEDANIAALSHDDIGMIFYVAIRNTDTCSYTILTRMVKCVEEIDSNDKDCEMMQLIGGDMGIIKPRCAKNITLVYPNYLLNRKGYCIIAIKFISEDQQMLEKKTNISFNTYIKGNHWKPLRCNNFFEKHRSTICESVDLDPLNNCEPVDCHMKYIGTRNYFNKRWKRCQKVPKCVYDPDKELPDVGYTPITNKCLDLEKCIKRAELTPLENKYAEMNDQNKYSMILTTIHCHHGKANNNTGLCDCDPGWGSAPFEPIPSLFTFHMCNIERNSWYDSNRSMVTFIAFFISISSVCVAMLVVLVSFVLYHLYKCLKNKPDKPRPDIECGSKSNSTQSVKTQDTPKSRITKDGVSDPNKTVYLATETSSRAKSGERTDTFSSDYSKASKMSKETYRLSNSTDSNESKNTRSSSKSKSQSTQGSSTEKSSRDSSIKARSSASTLTRDK